MTVAALCICGRPIRDAYLCPTCTHRLRADLRTLSGLIGNVELTASRQDQVNAPGEGRASGDRPLPFKAPATDLLRVIRRTVLGWARTRLRVTERQRNNPAALCARLADVTRQIVIKPDAQTLSAAVAQLINDARAVIDLPQAMRFLGHCDECGAALYAERTATHVECPSRDCPVRLNVDVRMTELITRSRDVVASPTMIATALTSLDQPVTEERIRKWKERGRLTARSLNGPRRQPWYRLGDVLDLLDIETERVRKRRAG